MSIFIYCLVGLYLIDKIREMTFFTRPAVNQVSVLGSPAELQMLYGERELGNTTFAIQVK